MSKKPEPKQFAGVHWCPTCKGKWKAVKTHYSAPGSKWHCTGCMKVCEKCTCR